MAAHTRDLFEYLAGLHAQGRLDTSFPNALGTIAYQLPCHLKAQNMGTRSADILRLTGTPVEVIDRCSAVDSTWGMKKEYFELSMKLAGPLFRDIGQAKPDRVATDCPLAALQIHRATGRERATPHPDPRRSLRPRPGASRMTRAIGLDDVVNFFEYEKAREERRRRVIELKRKRRVAVGPYLSFVFENRETLLFRIQEMCRAERIVDDVRVKEERACPTRPRLTC